MFEVLLNELPILLSADDVEAEASKLYAALASLNVEKLLVKFAISTFQKKHPKINNLIYHYFHVAKSISYSTKSVPVTALTPVS